MTFQCVKRGLAIATGALVLPLVLCGQPVDAEGRQAVVRAVVVRPLSLSNLSNLSFGTVLPNESNGTISLLPSGAFTADGVSVANNAKIRSATFRISGGHNQAYTIQLPLAVTFSGDLGSIQVITFQHDAGQTPMLNQEGYGTFNVGATLTFGQGLSTRTYSGNVDIIISNY